MAKLRITNVIRRLRFESGEMTQQALAKQVGVTRQTLAAIEKAKYSPSLELAILIARALGRPLDEVFFVEGEEALGTPVGPTLDGGDGGPAS